MLNYPLINELYHCLEPEKKKELLRALFGEGNQTMAYFKNGRDSRFSKVEILSDYFGVPIDMLREGTRYVYDSKNSKLTPLKVQPESSDKQKIKILEEKIKLLQEALSIKEDHINLLLEKCDFYKNQVKK